MNPVVYCVSYGSNLHPLRIQERVPSARALGVVELPGFDLAFRKRSNDRSGKCSLHPAPATRKAYGVLYQFDSGDKAGLDIAEGSRNGYFEQQVSVPLKGANYNAYLYMVSSTHLNSGLAPYHWYKNLVVAGAQFHGLPGEYVAAIQSVVSVEDSNSQRREENEALLRRMGLYGGG